MTSTVAEAYSSVYGVEWLPPVTKDMLIESNCTAIVVKQHAYRPKKTRRRESQTMILKSVKEYLKLLKGNRIVSKAFGGVIYV
uniref:AlNc14C364G11040 protein n=1 Tax=Albugo laibachii Nc14 TaxID=890382 RepID=F0WXV3_9STRA|nr:AlNc14C364G11040 [Albugo laibachii Nc14]|eukprot:CCA26301.1 AlNc14C364G11040 [Albugo laibachii Nc14]